MARTASSLASPSVTSAISLHMARLTALRILGRLKTTVAMPPSRSTRISSLMPLPLCASSPSPPPRCRPREGQSSGGVRELQFLSAESLWCQRVSSGILVSNMTPNPPARPRRFQLGLVLVVLAVALMPVRAVPDEPAWQVYFSPNHGATKAVVDALDAAKATVLVQAYSFTSAPIAEAHDRGVDVQVILDRKETGSKYSSADFLAHAGIVTLIDGQHAIAHNKVMVIDGVAIITGSFNFTTAAERQNAENLLVIHDRALAARYSENWRAHAAHSIRYAGR